MAGSERIDRVELAVFGLVRTMRKPERMQIAAQIIEEGLDVRQLPPLGEAPTVLVAVAVRAFRPPFKVPGGEEEWRWIPGYIPQRRRLF